MNFLSNLSKTNSENYDLKLRRILINAREVDGEVFGGNIKASIYNVFSSCFISVHSNLITNSSNEMNVILVESYVCKCMHLWVYAGVCHGNTMSRESLKKV